MQIRFTVLGPRGGPAASAGRACDVLVTAPAGTALGAVASGLASAVTGPDGASSGPVVLYAGSERLDPRRSTLGVPPLLDGAVLSLHSPAAEESGAADAAALLHVVAGPDAGGVHLLHGGRVGVGRSAEADVAVDDPDVSRFHCEVTVGEDGRVTVADLGSTNGTTVDGSPVRERPVRLAPGALLRVGESVLRLALPTPAEPLPTAPDGEGHLRVGRPGGPSPDGGGSPAEDRAADAVPAASGRPPAEPPARGGLRVPAQYAPSAPQAPSAGHPATGPHAPSGGATHGRPLDLSGVPGLPPRSPDAPAGGTDADGDGRPGAPPATAPGQRRRGIGAWARRLAGTREAGAEPAREDGRPPARPDGAGAERWPDPAALLLDALRPGPRLWERDGTHPESLVVRLGTADRADLASVPVTVGLREAGSLGLAGPRSRLTGLARSVVAQLAALHSPAGLELVLIAAERPQEAGERAREWGWLGWLPHLRPAHGQDCRLLLAFDRDQAAARTAELTRRLDDGPLGPEWPSADRAAVAEAAARHTGPRTVVVVDGDPGTAALREAVARLAEAGPAVGIHLVCLAETPAASPLSPVAATYEAACAASRPFRECGAVGLLSGEVATALRVLRVAGGRTAGHGTVGTGDGVSVAWAERFGRALAPLRAEGGAGEGRVSALPRSARLLDELGLARATPASLMARWASAGDTAVVLGAGPQGPVSVDLAAEGPHLLVEGPAGCGRTELLRSVAASLAAAARPDRLGLLLVDGAAGERGGGLAACAELPHVMEHLPAGDPVRMRAFAQALGGELKRRAELLAGTDFAAWHAARRGGGRVVGPRTAPEAADDRGDLHSPPSGTLRLRPGGRTEPPGPDPLPRLVVLVDDFDALVDPALGSPGRPASGSVVRALEAVAREGGRLGVHLVASSARPDRTADTRLAEEARLRVVLRAPAVAPGPEDPAPGRGAVGHPDGRTTAFQGGRVTGRIPRTATLRPTVVPLEWERMGDPPTRRPVRELGNGPTDLALLASALERAARSVSAQPPAPLTPAHRP
ncbi:FHA domain-containing protein [Streptomyces sp. C10-9-1]|uniref:FHA domain-containing protein n=1 Tax=Streptomyces sp. C10-9-1 TaxID=1859285 RepID=UPI003F4A3EDA